MALNPKTISDIVGEFGTWQRRVFLVSFFVNFLGIWQNLAVAFLAPDIEYWCISPEADNNSSYSDPEQHSVNKLGEADHCWVKTPLKNHTGGIDNETTVACTQWYYNTSVYSKTIASEWDLVCDREWMISFAKSIYMIGYMTSVFVFGQLSDYIGRYPTMVICYVILLISSVLSPFSTSFTMFAVLRFFLSMGRGGLMTTAIVLLMEVTGPKWSVEITIASQMGWAFGFSTLPALAWFIKPWNWIQTAIGIPIIPLICIFWIIPESPRWLLSQNRIEGYATVLYKGAKLNGREVDLDELRIQKQVKIEKTKKTIIDVLRTPKIRTRFLIVAFIWIANVYIYFAFSYNTDDLGGNVYLNFFLSGIVEVPSYAAIFSIRKFGRKIPFITGMFVSGAAFASIMIIPEDLHWLILTFAMIGKFAITATFGLLYIYTMELFPTVVRNATLGSCSTVGRVAAIISPFVRELGKTTHPTVPFAINAALSISAGALALLLPETKDKDLQDTLEERQPEYHSQIEMITKF